MAKEHSTNNPKPTPSHPRPSNPNPEKSQEQRGVGRPPTTPKK